MYMYVYRRRRRIGPLSDEILALRHDSQSYTPKVHVIDVVPGLGTHLVSGSVAHFVAQPKSLCYLDLASRYCSVGRLLA